jgi:nucleotide-binding universal stress UspA family protein
MWSPAVEPATGPILLAIEAVPQSQALVAATAKLGRAGVRARGLIRTARSGHVGEEIVYTADKHHADEIVVGTSRRPWLVALLRGSVAPKVLRRSDLAVVAVPTNGLPRHKRSATRVSA